MRSMISNRLLICLLLSRLTKYINIGRQYSLRLLIILDILNNCHLLILLTNIVINPLTLLLLTTNPPILSNTNPLIVNNTNPLIINRIANSNRI